MAFSLGYLEKYLSLLNDFLIMDLHQMRRSSPRFGKILWEFSLKYIYFGTSIKEPPSSDFQNTLPSPSHLQFCKLVPFVN